MKPWGAMREIPCTFDQQFGARKQWEYPGPETPHVPLELLMEQCDLAPDEQHPRSPEWLNAPKCHSELQVSAAVITLTADEDHTNTKSASDHGVEMPEMKVPVSNRYNVHPNSLDGEDAQPTQGTSTEDNSIRNISESPAHATTLLTSTLGTPTRTFTCIRESWTEEEKTARDQQYAQTLKKGDMIPWVRFLDGKDWAVVEQRKTCDSGYRSGHGNDY